MRYEFNIYIDHAQFYLEDSGLNADTNTLWDEESCGGILAIAEGLIAVGTARYGGYTRIIVECQDIQPFIDFEQCDKVAQCSIDVPSGRIIIYAPEQQPSKAPQITIPPGIYNALICYGGFNTVVDEMRLEGDDYYHVFLWKGTPIEPAILKQ